MKTNKHTKKRLRNGLLFRRPLFTHFFFFRFRLKWALDEQDLCLRAMMGYKTVFVDTWRANCNGDSIDFSAVYNRCPAESFFKCDNCRRAEEIGEAVGNFNAGPHVQSITAMIQEAKVADPPIRLNVPTIASIYRGDKNTVGFKKVCENCSLQIEHLFFFFL